MRFQRLFEYTALKIGNCNSFSKFGNLELVGDRIPSFFACLYLFTCFLMSPGFAKDMFQRFYDSVVLLGVPGFSFAIDLQLLPIVYCKTQVQHKNYKLTFQINKKGERIKSWWSTVKYTTQIASVSTSCYFHKIIFTWKIYKKVNISIYTSVPKMPFWIYGKRCLKKSIQGYFSQNIHF